MLVPACKHKLLQEHTQCEEACSGGLLLKRSAHKPLFAQKGSSELNVHTVTSAPPNAAAMCVLC